MSPPWICWPDPQQSGRDLARELELVAAQRDLALDSLAQLERIITATGGYMEHGDQARLFEARAVLDEHGRRRRDD